MKDRCPRPGPLVLALALLLSCAAAQPTQKTSCVKTVAWVLSPPYSLRDGQGGYRGLHVDLVREALRRMQCEARFVDIPWARAWRELQTGELDMVPGAANTAERQGFALFSRPTNSARNVVFVPMEGRKKFRITRLADIVGTDFRLGVRRDASYGAEYDQLVSTPAFASRLSFVPSANSALQMMAAGRLDGWVADELTGLMTVTEMGLGKQVVRSALITSDEADLVAFSKATSDPAQVQKFNEAIASMVADGSYKKLLERYLPCPVSVEKRGCR